MAVQVSYPGVYIEEFTPGAPIEGVGTNTAAFIGTATRGPIRKPTLIQSWDAFVSQFGGFITEQPASYLAPAVYGFFLNGGTSCYIVRVGTGSLALVNLDSRQGGANPDPALVARARQEGPGGNSLSVQVVNSSRLAAMLTRALLPRAITAVSADRLTLTVGSNQGYTGGESIAVTQGANSETVIVANPQGDTQLVLAGVIPGGVNFTGGSLTSAGVLTLRRTQTNILALSADRVQLTVGNNSGFTPGDRALLVQGANTATVVVKSLEKGNTLVLTGPVAGAVNFAGGMLRTADLTPGQRTLRLMGAHGLRLITPALPPGTAVSITLGGTSEIHTVESSGGDAITLTEGLTNAYSLADAADLPRVASLEFDLVITDAGTGANETFAQLAMNPQHPNYWGTVLASELVTIEAPPEPPAPMPADPRPAVATYSLANGTADDRAAAAAAIIANPDESLNLLKSYGDVALVCIPGFTDRGVQQAVISHCETMADRFAILDSIRGVTPGNGIRDQFANVRSARGFAALYYPWILARNPSTGKEELWPPSGSLAGIYARTDQQRGVHKAPANANIRGSLGLERLLTNEEQGLLNPLGINVLRVFPGQAQPIVWGARTTAGDLDRNWQYVNIRRLFLFLEESIEKGIRWAVFEPNNTQLWQKLKRTIAEFLTRVWRDGALFGETADKAFYVRIDEALNPESTQRLGRLYIEIGVRPAYPAEFIIVRIGIWQGGSTVTETE